jgi:hypothetical protein
MSEHPINTTNSDGATPTLSREGEHRRAAMLGELLGELESTRRGRAARKRLATAAGFGLIVTGAVVVAVMQSRPSVPTGGAGSASSSGSQAARAPGGDGGSAPTPPEPAKSAEFIHGVRIVRTDPSIVDRWRAAAPTGAAVMTPGVPVAPSGVVIRTVTTVGTSLADFAPDPAAMARVTIRALSDEELIDALAAIGRPAGIIRMGGKVWLSAAVTDEEIEKERERSRG